MQLFLLSRLVLSNIEYCSKRNLLFPQHPVNLRILLKMNSIVSSSLGEFTNISQNELYCFLNSRWICEYCSKRTLFFPQHAVNLFFSFPAAIIITWKLKENKNVIILPSAANENPQVPDRIRNTLTIKEYRMFVCSTL